MATIMSSKSHALASQRMLVKSVCRYFGECIEKMEPTDDPGKLKDVCEAVNKLTNTIGKLPAYGGGREEGGEGEGEIKKSVDELAKELSKDLGVE